MANLAKIILAIFIIPLVLFIQIPSANAFNLFTSSCQNVSGSSVCTDAKSAGSTNPAVHLIQVATSIIALATGIGAVAMIIIGGFTLVTSAGNPEAAATARRRIIYSVVGLVVVALAWLIIRFVTDRIIS